ncbi:MAG: transposase [Halanaerobium sp.]
MTSEKRPPISKNTFSNFRERVTDYYKETGTDLIPEGLKVYLEESHRNDVIYRTKNDQTKSKLQKLLEDAKTLYDTAVNADQEITYTEEFKLLKRMLGEQTDHDDDDFDDIDPDNIEAKDGKEIGSDILQNPSDPDANFRQKYEANIGYTANVVEFFDGNNSVIKSYDFKPNIYADQSFSADTLDKLTNDPAVKIDAESPFKLFMDGAYYSYDLARKAIKAGIKYMPGELMGKKPAADKMTVYQNFDLDSNYENILSCANDKEPDYQEKNPDKNSFYAVFDFDKEKCADCRLKSECRIKAKKKHNSISFTEKQYETGKLRKTIGEKEYIKECNQRAGVEGLPSVFRRKYNVDDMPVRSEVCQKIWFGFKVAAANFKKLLKGLKPATL